MSTKTSIHYNRSEKVWHVKNGTLNTTIKGKRNALLLALEHDHPELYRIVKQMVIYCEPAPGKVSLPLLDRLLRAAMLITKGKVFADGIVSSQTEPGKIHATDHENGEWECTCKDFEKGGIPCDYGKVCKHILSQMIASFLNVPLPKYQQ